MHEDLTRLADRPMAALMAAVIALGLGGCVKPDRTEPVRVNGMGTASAVPNVNIGTLAADCLQQPHAPATCHAMVDLLGRLDFDSPPGIDHRAVAAMTAKAVVWIIDNFGSPPEISGRVTLRVRVNTQPPARFIIAKRGDRAVEIESLLLHEGLDHFLVHELFHAFFQPTTLLDMGDNAAEAWATYAQYKYRYPTLSNADILRRVAAEFGLSAVEIDRSTLPTIPWDTLDEQSRRRLYALAVVGLLKRSEMENYVLYRQIAQRGADAISTPSPAPAPQPRAAKKSISTAVSPTPGPAGR